LIPAHKIVFLLQFIISLCTRKKDLLFSIYRITLAYTLLTHSHWFAKYLLVDFLLDGFFHRAKASGNVQTCQAHARCIKNAMFARCVEIERFMPRLIDSSRYYELYDFYKKSVLSYASNIHRSVSSSHRYNFNVIITHVYILLITVTGESYRGHAT